MSSALSWLACLLWLVLMYRADRRAMLAGERQTLSDTDVRQLVEAEICRIVAEWERSQLSEDRPQQLPAPRGRLQ